MTQNVCEIDHIPALKSSVYQTTTISFFGLTGNIQDQLILIVLGLASDCDVVLMGKFFGVVSAFEDEAVLGAVLVEFCELLAEFLEGGCFFYGEAHIFFDVNSDQVKFYFPTHAN